MLSTLAQLLAAKELDYNEYDSALRSLTYGMSIASLTGVLWTMFIFGRNWKRNRYLPHSQTLILLVFEMLSSIGQLLYTSIDETDTVFDQTWYQCIFYLTSMVGQYGTCINTALLALSLYSITSFSTQLVLKIRWYLNILGFILPFILGGTILSVGSGDIFDTSSHSIFYFEKELYVVIAVLGLCIFITIVSMIITQRKYKKNRAIKDEMLGEEEKYQNKNNPDLQAKLKKVLPEMDSTECNVCEWDNKEIICRFKVGSYHLYNHNCQIVRHTVLLICLTFCMLTGKKPCENL